MLSHNIFVIAELSSNLSVPEHLQLEPEGYYNVTIAQNDICVLRKRRGQRWGQIFSLGCYLNVPLPNSRGILEYWSVAGVENLA